MSFWDKETEIIIIDKNSREKIKVSGVESKGKKYIDIRIMFITGEELKPSAKGVVVPVEKLDEMMTAISSFINLKEVADVV